MNLIFEICKFELIHHRYIYLNFKLTNMIQSVKINVYGKVQGVGFRYSVLQKANDMGINGFVKNRTDGSVYMEIEAESDIIEIFVSWCKKDPSWSRVNQVKVMEIPFNNYRDFCIK